MQTFITLYHFVQCIFQIETLMPKRPWQIGKACDRGASGPGSHLGYSIFLGQIWELVLVVNGSGKKHGTVL